MRAGKDGKWTLTHLIRPSHGSIDVESDGDQNLEINDRIQPLEQTKERRRIKLMMVRRHCYKPLRRRLLAHRHW